MLLPAGWASAKHNTLLTLDKSIYTMQMYLSLQDKSFIIKSFVTANQFIIQTRKAGRHTACCSFFIKTLANKHLGTEQVIKREYEMGVHSFIAKEMEGAQSQVLPG